LSFGDLQTILNHAKEKISKSVQLKKLQQKTHTDTHKKNQVAVTSADDAALMQSKQI